MRLEQNPSSPNQTSGAQKSNRRYDLNMEIAD